MSQYKTLNDVPVVYFNPGRLEIWYVQNPTFRDNHIRLADLPNTHAHLGSIRGRGPQLLTEEELEFIFSSMQGEIWSPNGEARTLIMEKGLQHTSMSVGDVVKSGNNAYICRMTGWERLT